MERKAFFILEAGSLGENGGKPCPKVDSPSHNQEARGFIGRGGATCRNSTISSESHLEIGRPWSDQRCLGCFW